MSFLPGSAESVVFPVPESPKKRATSPAAPALAGQCMGGTCRNLGSTKFNAENTAFLISPVYPVPPMRIIFLERLMMEELRWRVPAGGGSAWETGGVNVSQLGGREFSAW